MIPHGVAAGDQYAFNHNGCYYVVQVPSNFVSDRGDKVVATLPLIAPSPGMSNPYQVSVAVARSAHDQHLFV